MTVHIPRAGGRVVELVAARELVVEQRDVPAPAHGEVLVRIRAVGICGTDVHGYLGRIDALPITLGHDAAGVLEAVGPDTTVDIPLGARVTIDPTVACGDCASCQSGLPQVCTRGSYLGMTATGTMADYITVAADRVVALPDTVSDAAATVLEPVAVALHLLDRVAGFALPSMRAHVIGGGPLGVLLGQTLTARGWAVTIHEPNEYRRAIAAACGLAVEESTGPVLEGPVLVVETSAAAAGVQVARELARPGSVVAFVGRAPADFTTAEILLGELSLLGIRAGVGHYPAAIELVASGAVTPEAIITHEFALASASEAFTSVIDPARRVMRAVLTV